MQTTIATPSASAPIIFNFTEQSIRIVSDDHDNPWFAATDICNVLGYANSRQAVQKNCKAGGVSIRDTIDNLGRMQPLTYINEGNLYRLIVKSRKPEAEKFEAWLMDEVLPSIRKTGEYAMRRPTSTDFSLTAQAQAQAQAQQQADAMAQKTFVLDAAMKAAEIRKLNAEADRASGQAQAARTGPRLAG